tara:strand:+ start:419 stop:901 length:483 start_codon:yes stop_codon:yes gene_type:complete
VTRQLLYDGIGVALSVCYVGFFFWFVSKVPEGRGPGIVLLPLSLLLLCFTAYLVGCARRHLKGRLGPCPSDGELLSSFKARRVQYSLVLFAAFAAVWVGAALVDSILAGSNPPLLLVIHFVGVVGTAFTFVSALGGSISWLKTKLIGPDLTLGGQEDAEH